MQPPISPEQQGLLELLQSPVGDALRLDTLFLFELDEGADGCWLLVLRAATHTLSHEPPIAMDEKAMELFRRYVHDPVPVDLEGASEPIDPLASFVLRRGYGSALAAPIQYEQRLWGCLVGCSRQCLAFAPFQLATFSLLASNVAAMLENRRLRAETVFRLSEAMSLETVSSALVEERNLDAILALIIDEAIRLLDASDALVLLLEEGGEWFQVRARKGEGVAGLARSRLSVSDSLNGDVIRTGKPLVSHNACTDNRANQPRARRLNVHTVAIAPLKIWYKTIGTIAVHNKRDGLFTQTDVDVLCSFANQAAIAIDNARLFNELLGARDEIQQKAQELQETLIQTMRIQEDERQRIAADIHDRVVSRIVGALYELETCIELHRRSEDLDDQLLLLKQLLNEAIEKTRTSIYNLWPATLEHMGLIPALRELLSHQEARTGIRSTVQAYGTPYRLRSTSRIAAYRIVQEALNNVHQHGGATSVEVSIRFSPRRLRIVIQDNGQGFDIRQVMLSPPARHFGLIGMRERALSVGGHLHVNSVPGRGSQVILEIPSRKARIEEEE